MLTARRSSEVRARPFWLIPAAPVFLIVVGTAASSGWRAMVNPVAVQRDLFRPVLLACQAELRLQHPQDVTLRVDLNSLGMSRYVERDDQRRWEVDGVVE